MSDLHEQACEGCGAPPAEEHDLACPVYLRNLRGGRGESFEYVVRAYRELLHDVPERDEEGTEATPRRAAAAWRELTAGYSEPAPRLTTFQARHDEMVVVAPIPFFSLCEHHILPFHGRAYIAYIPSGRVLGLSKFARVVQHFARRLQVQERLTSEIADYLEEGLAGRPRMDVAADPEHARLKPKGLAVVLRAEHLCMSMRGVAVAGALTTTSVMRGACRDQAETRAEVLRLMGVNGA